MAARTLTTEGAATRAALMSASAPPSPEASRVPGRRWRDWRLALGVLLVLGSTVAGARVVSAADDTVTVWAASGNLVAGTPLAADDLVPLAVRIEAPVNPYLHGRIPDGYLVTRDVGAGELVPSSAVAAAAEVRSASRLVALAIAPDSMPGRLGAGDRVDVWLVPDALADDDAEAELLVAGVSVAESPVSGGDFGAATTQETVVISLGADAVAEESLHDVTARLVAASAAGRVALTLDPVAR